MNRLKRFVASDLFVPFSVALLSVFVAFAISIKEEQDEKDPAFVAEKIEKYNESLTHEIERVMRDVRCFDTVYADHSYVVVTYEGKISATHSPDCKCKRGNDE